MVREWELLYLESDPLIEHSPPPSLKEKVFFDGVLITMHFSSASWCLALSIASTTLFPLALAETIENKPPKSGFTFDELWELEKGFWDAFLYPANTKQTQGNESTIFAADVRKIIRTDS
jgi:hypothetical protein